MRRCMVPNLLRSGRAWRKLGQAWHKPLDFGTWNSTSSLWGWWMLFFGGGRAGCKAYLDEVWLFHLETGGPTLKFWRCFFKMPLKKKMTGGLPSEENLDLSIPKKHAGKLLVKRWFIKMCVSWVAPPKIASVCSSFIPPKLWVSPNSEGVSKFFMQHVKTFLVIP